MNLKKMRIISVIGIFVLCFLTHYIYEWCPNTLTSIFFPVNESIWEHMKMIYTTILLYYLIEYFLLKKLDIKVNNFVLASFTSAFSAIPIFLAMYLPIFYHTGYHMISVFIVLLITLAIIAWINYKICNTKSIRFLDTAAILLIIICYIIFGYLTHYPLYNDLFLDTENEKYGISIYQI